MFFGRGSKDPNGVPIIRNKSDYAETLQKASELSKVTLVAYDAGEPLSQIELDQLHDASRMYDALSRFAPDKMGPLFLNGKIQYVLGDFATAEADLRKSITVSSKTAKADADTIGLTIAEAHHLLALCRLKANDFQGAYAESNEALKTVSHSANYLATRARTEVQIGKVKEAAEDCRLALQIDPQNSIARGIKSLIDASGSSR